MPQGKWNSVVVGIGTTQVKWKTPPKAAYRTVPFWWKRYIAMYERMSPYWILCSLRAHLFWNRAVSLICCKTCRYDYLITNLLRKLSFSDVFHVYIRFGTANNVLFQIISNFLIWLARYILYLPVFIGYWPLRRRSSIQYLSELIQCKFEYSTSLVRWKLPPFKL